MNIEQLNQEIEKAVVLLESDQKPVVNRWVANAICRSHEGALIPDHKDQDFWIWVGHKAVHEAVKKYMGGRYDETPETIAAKRTPVLPGFEHLLAYYPVERDAEGTSVPLASLTDQEIEDKIFLYENMGAGCYAHADELRRFKELRRRQTA